MADVTGPISTLPGSSHRLPKGTMCDRHPDRLAVARIQGETDSMGCEMNDVCEACLKADREYARSPEARTGTCDWCKADATDLADTRDYEEGMAGPVYRVCAACRKRRDEEDREYNERWERENPDYGDDWGDDE